MRRIVFDGSGKVVESQSAPQETLSAPPVVEFKPSKKYVPKQYNPHVNTKDTQYHGGCSGCGKTVR